MARPQDSPILAQLRNAKTSREQADALQALKNELVGHIQKKEAWIGLGILDPIVRTLTSGSAKLNGQDGLMQESEERLSDEERVKLQAIQLIACLANGGPAFLSPLHAARVLPAILGHLSPQYSPPQIVVASLRALVNVAAAASLAPRSSPLDRRSLADHVFTPHHIESFNVILSSTSPLYIIQTQITLVSTLISSLCREEKHQNTLVMGGVLDSLAYRLASFAVASGLVLPGARQSARENGLRDVFPEPAPGGAKIGPILEAVSCILGDSKYRANRLVHSPVFLAIFPKIMHEPLTKHNWGWGWPHEATIMDALLPAIMISAPRAQNKCPAPEQPDLRMSSKASSSRFSAAPLAETSRFQSGADTTPISSDDLESPLMPWLIYLVRALKDYDRLMAAAVIAALLKAGLGRKVVREQTVGLLVVPVLVGVIVKNDKDDLEAADTVDQARCRILEKGAAVLAKLITDNEHLQKAAYESDAPKVLAKLLKQSYSPAAPAIQIQYWSPNPDAGMEMENASPAAKLGDTGLDPVMAHKIALREATLKAIGALSAGKEDYRKALVAEGLVPFVVESLSEFPRRPKSAKDKAPSETTLRTAPSPAFGTNPTSVIIAACHVVRTLARSVNILRTALVDHAVALPINHFLRHLDVNVQVAATAAIINLVIEVSPVRELLTQNGVMKALCEHAHSQHPVLRLNALWALKHFVDAVGTDLKKACLKMLEPRWLVHLICNDSQDVYSAKESAADEDDDKDVDMHASDEPPRWVFMRNGVREELDARHSTVLRRAEDVLQKVRESELSPARQARSNDVAVQEQCLDFVRNFIGRPEPGLSSEAPSETVDMIDYLFHEIGQDRLFDILASKLRPKRLRGFGRRDASTGQEGKVVHPQAKIVVAVICILVHLAATIPRHRQMVIAQTELLRLLVPQLSSKDRNVRVSLCHLVINLTWQEDDGEAQPCVHRALELKRLGFYAKLDVLQHQDRDLDVRERAKTAVWQIDQATF